jgi:hypothetical protein
MRMFSSKIGDPNDGTPAIVSLEQIRTMSKLELHLLAKLVSRRRIIRHDPLQTLVFM